MNLVKSLVNELALSTSIGFFIFCLACSPAEAGMKYREQHSGKAIYFQQLNRATKTSDPYEPDRSRGYDEDLYC